MCLYLKNKNTEAETVEEDKTVYKVFICYITNDGRILINSPYLTHQYNEKYNEEKNFEHFSKEKFVNVGFHSFDTYEDALVLKNYFERTNKQFSPASYEYTHAIVLECVIPKGSEIFVGEFAHLSYSTMPTSYCSNKLIIKDQQVTLRDGKLYDVCLE